MSALEPHLPDIWLFIIGFFLLYYAIADGFDLGVGILSLFSRDDAERGLLMGTIQSIWHDNETWLVLLGGMLFGAFPVFYGMVLSALYIPILIMLFGLMFRGVAFEFRHLAVQKPFWSTAFGIGSLIATLAQGFALGGLIGGIEIREGQFAGSEWAWLNPFSVLVAVGVLCGYTMLGANYLIVKTEGDLQRRSIRYAWTASLATFAIAGSVHIWSTLKHPHVIKKWLEGTASFSMGAFLALAALGFLMLFRSLLKRQEGQPFIWNIVIILASFTALSIGLYPQMIPPVLVTAPLTVHAAAASSLTLEFMLVVTGLLLPVILTYTSYKHRVFWGKVKPEGYGGESVNR